MSTEQGRERALVGELEFPEEYSDPAVDVTQSYHVADHEIVNNDELDEFAVQVMGRQPAQIVVTGIIRETDLDDVETMETADRPLAVRTERWYGTALARRIETSYRREKDSKGYWLYDIRIELVEVAEQTYEFGAQLPSA